MNSTANKKHRSDIYASTISPLVLFGPSCSSFSESSSTRYAPEEEREKIAYGEKQKAEKTSEPRKRSGILAIFLSLLSFPLAYYGYEQLCFFQNGRLVRRFFRPCTLQTHPKEMLVCKYAKRKEESREKRRCSGF